MHHNPLATDTSPQWLEAKRVTDHMESDIWQTHNVHTHISLRALVQATKENTAIQRLLQLGQADVNIVQYWVNRLLFCLEEARKYEQFENPYDASVFLYEFLIIGYLMVQQDWRNVAGIANDIENRGFNLFWGTLYPHAFINGQL